MEGKKISAAIIFIVLLYLILLLWFSESIFNYNKTIKKGELKKVSVVISARDEEKNLINLYNFLENQTYPKELTEIIIVDDKSIDSSFEILQDLSKKNKIKLIRIKKTPIGWASKKWALTQAIESATGEIIMQTDADCQLHPGWITSVINQFNNDSIIFVSSPSLLKQSKSKLLNQLFYLDSLAQDAFSAGSILNNIPLSSVGRNIAFYKKNFLNIDGYKNIEDIDSGDDDLFMHKMLNFQSGKVTFLLDFNAIVWSEAPLNFLEFAKQRLRYASKGIIYYKTSFVNNYFKMIVPFLFLINLLVMVCLIRFGETGQPILMVPLAVKFFADFILLYVMTKKLKLALNLTYVIILSFIHPFYIVIFGFLGPLVQVKWKK